MADVLKFTRKQPTLRQVPPTSDLNSLDGLGVVEPIEDLKCGLWTTRKLRVPTSRTGYLVIECFESADGKRLKGSGTMEPQYQLSNLEICVEKALSVDKLTLFAYCEDYLAEDQFMSHVLDYPVKGGIIILLSLAMDYGKFRCKLWL